MENIVENNKLIAEFMGYKYIGFNNDNNLKPGWWKNDNNLLKLQSQEKFNTKIGKSNFLCRKHNELRYYNSWNWLMEVIEKIENTKIKDYSISTNITDDRTFINVWHYGDGGKWSILISNLNEEYKDFNKMQRTYKAVVKFINFYNKQKEE